MNPKLTKIICTSTLLCATLNFNAASAADDTNAPAISAATPTTNAPAMRRANRGGPLTPDEVAEVAKLDLLPAWTPGDGDGDYSIARPFTKASELMPRDAVPKGRVESFLMNAADSKFYPDTGLRGATPTRKVTVYIPSQYVPDTAAPFIVTADAYGASGNQLPTILDNMIADHRLPVMIAVMIKDGGGDGGGSERGLEYDTVSAKNCEFIEAEVLPRVEKDYGVTLTKDPDGRAAYGGSSGGAAAFTMAWFHPELYHRVLIYSGTFVNQHPDADYPHGAWEYPTHLVPENPAKPIRIWMEVGEHDNGATNTAAAFHNWRIANERMAAALKAKGYHYQFIYAKGGGHVDGGAVRQTLPEALEYVWQGYPIK
jgi:iron(III)-enterobactin esterase